MQYTLQKNSCEEVCFTLNVNIVGICAKTTNNKKYNYKTLSKTFRIIQKKYCNLITILLQYDSNKSL